ncbi:hypothetical protein ACOSQ2_012259 [Xanthoceras sorbifolium]
MMDDSRSQEIKRAVRVGVGLESVAEAGDKKQEEEKKKEAESETMTKVELFFCSQRALDFYAGLCSSQPFIVPFSHVNPPRTRPDAYPLAPTGETWRKVCGELQDPRERLAKRN